MPMNEKEMQEKVFLYQLLQKHLESLSQNAVMLERRYEEIESTRAALEDIEKLKEKNEILVPLGSGFFTYGKVTDSGKIMAEIGGGVFMDKDPQSGQQVLEERKQEIEKLAGDMQREMTEVSERMNMLAEEVEQASHEGHDGHEHVHSEKGKAHVHKDE